VTPVVLFVDDDEDWREALVPRLLRDLPINLWCVGRPERALEILHTTPPDLMITDLLMPASHIDGHRLALESLRLGINTMILSSLPSLGVASVPRVSKDKAVGSLCMEVCRALGWDPKRYCGRREPGAWA